MIGLAASIFLSGSLAFAGMPQPGMVLYGKVIRGAETVTDGTLEWTYTPSGGGAPVTVKVTLQSASGADGETLSYSVLIPLDLQVSGYPAETGKVLLSSRPTEITRSASIDGQPLRIGRSVLGETFTPNADVHIGMVERVDLLFPSVEDCCLGDADYNKYVNLDDYVAVRNRFGDPVPEVGDADCNGFVNLADYGAVRSHFGDRCEETAVAGKTASVEGSASSLSSISRNNANAVLSLRVDPGEVNVDDSCWVSVTLETIDKNARAVAVFVNYDASLLRFAGGMVDTEAFDDALLTAARRVVAPGIIAFSAAAEHPAPPGERLVAILEFTAVSQGTAELRLLQTAAAETKVKDANFQDVVTATRGATLQVRGTDGSSTPGGTVQTHNADGR